MFFNTFLNLDFVNTLQFSAKKMNYIPWYRPWPFTHLIHWDQRYKTLQAKRMGKHQEKHRTINHWIEKFKCSCKLIDFEKPLLDFNIHYIIDKRNMVLSFISQLFCNLIVYVVMMQFYHTPIYLHTWLVVSLSYSHFW